jgi:hypothetical protein
MRYTVRRLSEKILFSLENSPVVFLNGPRQSGKTTLARELARRDYPAEYVSFDNVTHMEAAYANPESFLRQRKGSVIIDEVQLVPELFRALKIIVDETRLGDKEQSNGRFLLTGSANIMVLPKLSDSLVGRMSIRTLYPFAACEVIGTKGDFPGRVFSVDFADVEDELTLGEAMESATFPEISGKAAHNRGEWFDGYLTTILQRDVRTVAELEKIGLLPRLLRVLAARAGKLMNDAEIARDMGLSPVTSKSYRGVLQAMFLGFDVEPWYRNVGKRLVKSAKGYIIDTLLLCHLLDRDLEGPRGRWTDFYGHAVENFVASELRKQLSFSDVRADLFHFRTADNKEVDFVLERPDGSVAGIEVKASERVGSADFKGMGVLRDLTKDDFICGVVLYGGKDVVPFGDRFFAVPFSALWR